MLAGAGPAQAAFPGENGKIAFHSGGEIYAINPDGTGLTKVIDNGSNPAFSPDGTTIAFDRNIGAGNLEIFVASYPGGGGQRNLTNNPHSNRSPAYSPDGTKIAYWSSGGMEEEGGPQIFVMNADGSGQRNLINDTERIDSSPTFSPDGTRIAFSRVRQHIMPDGRAICCGDGEDIWVMNADGSGKRNLTNSPLGVKNWTPSYSPDGRKIVFARWQGSSADIYVMNADGSNQTRLATSGWSPTYSPDGRKIVFARGGPSAVNPGLYVMNANGGRQTRLTKSGKHDAPDWQALAPVRASTSAKKVQQGTTVAVKVSCQEACTATGGGTVVATSGAKGRALRATAAGTKLSVKLKPQRRQIAASPETLLTNHAAIIPRHPTIAVSRVRKKSRAFSVDGRPGTCAAAQLLHTTPGSGGSRRFWAVESTGVRDRQRLLHEADSAWLRERARQDSNL